MSEIKLSASDRVVITNGEYSDYRILGHFQVVCDFDVEKVLERFKKIPSTSPSFLDWGEFITWLQNEGYIRKTASFELWLGAYTLGEDMELVAINA